MELMVRNNIEQRSSVTFATEFFSNQIKVTTFTTSVVNVLKCLPRRYTSIFTSLNLVAYNIQMFIEVFFLLKLLAYSSAGTIP